MIFNTYKLHNNKKKIEHENNVDKFVILFINEQDNIKGLQCIKKPRNGVENWRNKKMEGQIIN